MNHIYVPRLPEEPAPLDFGDLDFDSTQIAKLKRATSGVLYLVNSQVTQGYAMIESKDALCVPALTWRARARACRRDMRLLVYTRGDRHRRFCARSDRALLVGHAAAEFAFDSDSTVVMDGRKIAMSGVSFPDEEDEEIWVMHPVHVFFQKVPLEPPPSDLPPPNPPPFFGMASSGAPGWPSPLVKTG